MQQQRHNATHQGVLHDRCNLGRGQENAFRQAVSAGIMACVVGKGEKTRCCTGKERLVVKVAEKWGFTLIFEPDLNARILQKSRTMTYVECAVAGDRRKCFAGWGLRCVPGAIRRTEVQVALRLINVARRVN
jgi:hypothetical protein